MEKVALVLAEFMSTRSSWQGTSSELLAELSTYAGGDGWPQSPKGLTQRLKVLHSNEIKVGFRRLGTARLVTLNKVSDTFSESDRCSDTSEAELVIHAMTHLSNTPPLESPRNWQQAPHVDCHHCKHYQGWDNPDYRERSCAVKQWHFPCYGWRPCSKEEEVDDWADTRKNRQL